MAYELTAFKHLVIKNGLAGTPQLVYGTPPMWQDSETYILTNIETSYNSGYSAYWWDTDPMDQIRARYMQGGISIAQYVENNMTVGDKAYIYNPDVGDNFALIIYKDTLTSAMLGARFQGVDEVGYYNIQGIGASCDDRQGVMMHPFVALGFARDPGTKTANVYAVSIISGWDSATFNWQTFSTSVLPHVSYVTQIMMIGNVPAESSDPYAPGNTSTPGGGENATYDDASDPISVPTIPSLNLSLNHFISAYVPTLTELNNLADYIWGQYDKTDVSKLLSKVFADPRDAIISLHMLPFTPGSSTAIEVTIGRYASGVNMSPMTAQFTDVDCGSLDIEPYWDNYLDYNPFTRLVLFLPYVGEVTLDPDEVMGQTLSVVYRVDNLTGAFVCFLSIPGKVIAQYNGCCSLSVPVSAADYTQLNTAILNAATSAVEAATGFDSKGGESGAVSGALKLVSGAVSSAVNVLQSKVHHSHSGALGGAAGFLGSQKPYVIIHRARQCLPEGLNERCGYPAMITRRMGDLSGFTSVSSIIMDGLPYTDGELSELAQILKEGVIL